MPAPLAGEEIVTVVDAGNRPVAALPRRRVRRENLPHRAAFVFVFDRKGRLLVQRRTATKDMYPGRYDLAAGGVVAAGESYEACARRETAEELGIRDAVLEPKFDFYYEDERNRCFGRVFACVHEGPFTLQPEEVADAAFHDAAAVAAGRVAPVTPDTRLAFERLLDLDPPGGPGPAPPPSTPPSTPDGDDGAALSPAARGKEVRDKMPPPEPGTPAR